MPSPCSANAVCQQLDVGFECQCNEGYALRSNSLTQCAEINACVDFPCSTFSVGACVDLDPPAGNTREGRTCGPCKAGYSPYNDDYPDTCVASSIVDPPCSCPAMDRWVPTECGFMDVRLCSSFVGNVTRLCDNSGVWQTPDESQCVNSMSH